MSKKITRQQGRGTAGYASVGESCLNVRSNNTDAPILRALCEPGEIYDDPSEDLLFMLLEDMESPGSSLTVERLESGREGEFMRVTLDQDGRYQVGDSTQQGTEAALSMRHAHESLTRWAFDLPPSWQGPDRDTW